MTGDPGKSWRRTARRTGCAEGRRLSRFPTWRRKARRRCVKSPLDGFRYLPVASTEHDAGAVNLRDLGIPRRLVGTASLAAGVLLGATTLVIGQSLPGAAVVAGLGAAATTATAAWIARRLGQQTREPLAAILRAIDQLRLSGQAQRVPEQGAPMLQPLLRKLNLAGAALEQRSQKSLASLLSAEAAFDRVHAVLQSLREGVVVIDTSGRVVLANRNARRMLQLEGRRVEAEALLTQLQGPLLDAVRQSLSQMDAQGLPELRVDDVLHEGRIYDLSLVQVQSNRPDQDYGKVFVLADVTKRHEVNRLKDELLSSISHELRTPLTNMCSSSEILTSLSPEDEAEWREFAGMLNTESRRLKTLVDDIMELGRLEGEQEAPQLEPTDLGDLVRTAAGLLRAAAAARSITLEVVAQPGCTAAVDARRLQQALCRLLDNAVKFTPEGGRILVSTTRRQGTVEIGVADSGPGVPAPDRERIFERFTQLGDVMTGKPAGAGLGLPIVRRIVQASGGTVRCDESDSGGALLVVTLPALAPAVA